DNVAFAGSGPAYCVVAAAQADKHAAAVAQGRAAVRCGADEVAGDYVVVAVDENTSLVVAGDDVVLDVITVAGADEEDTHAGVAEIDGAGPVGTDEIAGDQVVGRVPLNVLEQNAGVVSREDVVADHVAIVADDD